MPRQFSALAELQLGVAALWGGKPIRRQLRWKPRGLTPTRKPSNARRP